MDIFTYLMSKKGKNYLSHKNDLFAYLLSRSTNKYFYQTFTGITLSVDNTLNASMKIKLNASEMSQSGTPTPESPQDIHIISGSNTIVVRGKNLFDKDNTIDGKEIQSGNLINSSDWCVSDYIMVENNQTYIKNISSGNSIILYDKSYTVIDSTLRFTNDKLTINNANAKYIQLNLPIAYKNNYQLELGETSTTYEPYVSQEADIYLGDIEYCKKGNYEDEFIRSNDGTWQLKKSINKVVLDGTENWAYAGITGVFYSTSITDYAISNNIPYSNYYKGVNNVTGPANMGTQNNNTIGFINQSGQTTPRFYIKDTTYTSENDLKTWLTNHNMILYYVLATPTYTQITGTLAEQLENIYQKLKSFKGTTNISQVNNDLPFILHCEIAMKIINKMSN